MIAGFRDFEFSLADALLRDLVSVLDAMETAELLPPQLADIPEAQGVYQLYRNGSLVYVGKTDGEAGLKYRLDRHAWTIQHRKNLEPKDISFKAVRVLVFTAMDLETLLIRHYGQQTPIPWNMSGFGSNDPGRNRDHTVVRAEGFDASFPIDIDRPLPLELVGITDVGTMLNALKQAVPYIFRFEGAAPKSRKPHPDLVVAKVVLRNDTLTMRALIKLAIDALPPGWQATVFPGRVIVYRERFDYEHGVVIARS